MTPSIHPQRGIALVAALVMLVLLTLLAVTLIRSGTVNLMITQNMQLQQEAENSAQRAIEQLVSNVDAFDSPAATNATIGDYAVAMEMPVCLGARPRPGDSMAGEGSLVEGGTGGTAGIELVDWELTATSTDPTLGSGTRVRINQGIRIEMLAGRCL